MTSTDKESFRKSNPLMTGREINQEFTKILIEMHGTADPKKIMEMEMISAIEQTKREMYDALRRINNFVKMNCHMSVVKIMKDFNDPLDAHLEQLRQQITEQADTIRVMELASQTSAEVIRGLREELQAAQEAREEMASTPHQKSEENAPKLAIEGHASSFACNFISGTQQEGCSHTLTSYGRCTKCLELFRVNGEFLIDE